MSMIPECHKNKQYSGLKVAFRSGAVMGLTGVGLGLPDIALWRLSSVHIGGKDRSGHTAEDSEAALDVAEGYVAAGHAEI